MPQTVEPPTTKAIPKFIKKIPRPQFSLAIFRSHRFNATAFTVLTVILTSMGMTGYLGLQTFNQNQQYSNLSSAHEELTKNSEQKQQTLEELNAEIEALNLRDEYKINKELESEIASIRSTYSSTVTLYEDLIKLREQTKDTAKFDDSFTNILTLLSDRNYSSASAQIKTLAEDINAKQAQIAATFQIPTTVASNNSAPGSGYSRQKVSTSVGEFMVDIIAADLGSTKVIVDTASSSDCGNDCPVLALGDYVARNGAFAGINGSYFCPASYPSCVGKTNSFDLLVMNKDKTYFNSDNNVYSTNPAVIFGSGWVRFVGGAQEWGRDTSVDGVLSNYPLLVSGGGNVFGGDDDPKKGSRAGRSFVSSKGSTVYIGVVYSSTVAEAAHVLTTLGMENALNLDSGGSTALWHGGYKTGPGRAIPNAILFVRK